MKKLILLIVLGIIANNLYAQSAGDVLSQKINLLAESSSINGFGVAIFNGEGVLYSQGFGFADVEKGIPYTASTIQKVASISKLFLGLAIMKADELQLLDLDDDVNDYLPFELKNPYFVKNTITIRHLATHTSGIDKTKLDFKALYFENKIQPLKKQIPFGIKRIILGQVLKKLNTNEYYDLQDFLYEIYDPKGQWYKKRNFQKSRAGEKYMYSNNGASMLALILEKVSGLSYEDYLQEHIFSVLKMDHTTFDFEASLRSAGAHSKLYHAGIEIPNDYNLLSFPAGGIETSVEDFAIFMSAMINGYEAGNEILNHDAFQIMMKQQLAPTFEQGILWEVFEESIGHSGDLAGVSTRAYFDKRLGMGYLLFANTAMTKNLDQEIAEIIEILKESYSTF